MAQDTFTPEQIENLKGHFRSIIKDIVLKMLPDIMKISSSIIPSVIKEITPKIIESIQTTEINETRTAQETQKTKRINETAFKRFQAVNTEHLDKMLIEREENYYQYRRCDSYLCCIFSYM